MRLAVFVCMLVGCGGGGRDSRPDASQSDADAGEPDAPDVPTISVAYPANGAVDVYRVEQVRATFTHDMDPSTITTATFQVLGAGTPMTGTVYYEPTTKIATFTPAARFDRSASYTAVITAAATDMAGRPLAADYLWSFTVTAGRWTPAQYLGSNGASGGLWVTRDTAGNVTAWWPTFQGPHYSRTKPSGQNWGAAVAFTTTLTSSVLVDIVFNDAGDGMAIWLDGSFGAYDCWATRYTQGQWGAPARIETLTDNCATARVAIAANGDASVGFRVESPSLSLWWNRFDHTTGWGTASQVTTIGVGADFLVTIDSAGITHLAYRDDSALSVTRYTASAWTSPQALGTGGNMRMLRDGNGNVTLVWMTFATANNLMASRYTGGSSWSSAVQINDSGGYARFPELAVDGAGNVLVAYGQLIGQDYSLVDAWTNRYTVGTGWGTPMKVETNPDKIGENVSVAIDSNGDAIVAWTAGATDPTTQVYVNRYLAGSGWQGATAVATDYGVPRAVFDGDHFPIMLWQSFNTLTINASEF